MRIKTMQVFEKLVENVIYLLSLSHLLYGRVATGERAMRSHISISLNHGYAYTHMYS